MDPVAAGPAAEGDDLVAGVGLLLGAGGREDADVADVDERVADEVLVEVNAAVDRRDAHRVAVVADPRHDPVHDRQRVQAALRQRVGVQVGRREAEHVGVGDRPRGEAGAEHVPDDAADARAGASERLDRRRSVVGLHLDADRVRVVELDDARVVDEHRHAEVPIERPGDVGDRGLEQVVDRAAFEAHGAGQRLVLAVLAPGLGERLQLQARRRAAELGEVLLDGLHLVAVEGEAALLRDRHERALVEARERHVVDGQVRRRRLAGQPRRQLVDEQLLHGVVGEPLARDREQLSRCDVAVHVEGLVGARGDRRQVHVTERLLHRVRDRVRDPWLRHDGQRVGALGSDRCCAGRVDRGVFDHRVAQDRSGERLDLRAGQRVSEEVAAPRTDARHAVEPSGREAALRRVTDGVQLVWSSQHIDSPRLHLRPPCRSDVDRSRAWRRLRQPRYPLDVRSSPQRPRP